MSLGHVSTQNSFNNEIPRISDLPCADARVRVTQTAVVRYLRDAPLSRDA